MRFVFEGIAARGNQPKVPELNAQARIYGEITSACLELSACKVIQTWGVSDNHSWIANEYPDQGWALLWDGVYRKKPAYTVMLDALSGSPK